MLYILRVRQTPMGVQEKFIEAKDQIEAEWRGRTVCEEQLWRFISVTKAVIADEQSHPMPKVIAEKKTARIGA